MTLPCDTARYLLASIKNDLARLQTLSAPHQADDAFQVIENIEERRTTLNEIWTLRKAEASIVAFEIESGVDFISSRFRIDPEKYNIRFRGHFDLSENTLLTYLPPGLTFVDGDLDLVGCTGLAELPRHLVVDGYLNLKGCIALKKLPKRLTVHGDLLVPKALEDQAAELQNLKLIEGHVYIV